MTQDKLIEAMARAVSKPLGNMAGGCFKPDNGRSDRGNCGDGDCYCARVTKHVARAALAAISATHAIMPRVLDEGMIESVQADVMDDQADIRAIHTALIERVEGAKS